MADYSHFDFYCFSSVAINIVDKLLFFSIYYILCVDHVCNPSTDF